jgi:signal transduction histidine kinase
MVEPDETPVQSSDDYAAALAEYLLDHSERALYRASLLSQHFIESGLGPEDIIALHFESLDQVLEGRSYREQARMSGDAQQFLLEVMIAYGVKYKEYLELRLTEALRDAETRAVRDRERIHEAERLERERSELLQLVAHELRSPITAAAGHLRLAERFLSRRQYDSLPQSLGSAREAVARLSRLTGDLVEATRGGTPRLERAPLPLVPVVEQACQWAQVAAQNKGVELRSAVADADVRVLGNADALLSVVGNLLSNAVRYTPPGGRVSVRLGGDAATAWFEVEDTGIGIAPEARERIFNKFWRAPDARDLDVRGLGLGLALVKQMTEAHDGRVTVESAPGQGSTFRVELPRYSETGEGGEHGGGT